MFLLYLLASLLDSPVFFRIQVRSLFSWVFFIYIPDDSASEIYVYRSETYGVFNRHFAIFLNDCTPDMFLLAYLLDPSEWVMTCQSIISSQHSLLPRRSFEAGAATSFNIFKALGITPRSSAYRICTSNASV
jgi:hypothetical protein